MFELRRLLRPGARRRIPRSARRPQTAASPRDQGPRAPIPGHRSAEGAIAISRPHSEERREASRSLSGARRRSGEPEHPSIPGEPQDKAERSGPTGAGGTEMPRKGLKTLVSGADEVSSLPIRLRNGVFGSGSRRDAALRRALRRGLPAGREAGRARNRKPPQAAEKSRFGSRGGPQRHRVSHRTIRRVASAISSGLRAKQMRRWPSPPGPNADPGAAPTPASSIRRNASARESGKPSTAKNR